MFVEADSEEEAVIYAQNHIDELDDNDGWVYGESTADYAEEAH